MSALGLGPSRCSTLIHAAIAYPLPAACVAAVIGGVTAVNYMPSSQEGKVAIYCSEPTDVNRKALPADIQVNADELCVCLTTVCGK